MQNPGLPGFCFYRQSRSTIYSFHLTTYYLCNSIPPIMIQHSLLAMGTNEIIIILVIVLLLFGGRKIPELMRGLGKGVREFNDAKTNVKREIEESANEVKTSVKE